MKKINVFQCPECKYTCSSAFMSGGQCAASKHPGKLVVMVKVSETEASTVPAISTETAKRAPKDLFGMESHGKAGKRA